MSPLPCYSLADSADDAERNAAGCIISQRKTVWVDGEVHSVIVFFVVIVVLGFVCVNLRDLRENTGVSFVLID